MRVGLIGYGKWGQAHAKVFSAMEDVQFMACAVPSIESRRAAQGAHGVAVYEDYREMLGRSDLDVIDVVSPNYLHHEMALAVLESGRDLILEKPMAATAAQCDEILALARARGRLIAIPHEYHYSPLLGGVRKMVEQGMIGKPLYLMMELWRRPFRAGASGWKRHPKTVLSWFLEEPIHYFDLARWYFREAGEPARIYARGSSRGGPESELFDNMSAMIDFPGGAYAVFTQSLAAWGHSQSIKLAGTTGAIAVRWVGSEARAPEPEVSLTYFDGTEPTQVPFDAGLTQMEQLGMLIRDALQAFRERKEPLVSGVDGRASVALCEAAETSIRTGMPVVLG